MKKLLLTVGSVVATAAPVAAVVACGRDDKAAVDAWEYENNAADHLCENTMRDAAHALTVKNLTQFKKSLAQRDAQVIESVFNTQADTMAGRNIIGVLWDKDNAQSNSAFHGFVKGSLRRFTFLVDGGKDKSEDAKQWGGSTLKVVYGANISEAKMYEGHTTDEVAGYISVIMETDHNQVTRVSTGLIKEGTEQDFVKSNDIYLFNLVEGVHPTFGTDHLQKDILDRGIYGNIAWSDPRGLNLINSGLAGKDVAEADYNLYTKVKGAVGLWIKAGK